MIHDSASLREVTRPAFGFALIDIVLLASFSPFLQLALVAVEIDEDHHISLVLRCFKLFLWKSKISLRKYAVAQCDSGYSLGSLYKTTYTYGMRIRCCHQVCRPAPKAVSGNPRTRGLPFDKP